jgi:hypothetical protein
MNEFELTFEKRGRYVFVKGRGIRKSLQAVFESTKELTRIIEVTGSRFVLLDYSELVTEISSVDTFNITRLYETNAPVLFQLGVSIVINPAESNQEEFWEQICQKRGFNFKIFRTGREAEIWLLKEIGKIS